MEYLNVTTIEFERFILILVRVGSMLFSAPVIGSPIVPSAVKVAAAAAVSMALFPTVGATMLLKEMPFYELAGLALGEVMLGLAAGLLARLFLAAMEVGAEAIGFQMGFGIATSVDPTTQAHTALLSQFQSAITALIFLATDAHYYFFRAISDSFGRIPLMGFHANRDFYLLFLQVSRDIFIVAVQFAAPATVVLLLTSLALGIVARTVPQMNIFIVGISVQVAVGFGALFVSLSMMGLLYGQVFTAMGGSLLRLVRSF
ncbi:MAG: flagellar biosynthetic protein FliR [Candidatus Tectomicrobia bacterium]|uniref:Flagellar biosynthetic protein FliR n=1 Tax=Tectimicrobiota bacterium TaxID=2528274 RepID=A0A932I2L6_UNCTE|nr:flagellar biosynthetic protein FliR [Candidatus Tectomicrobia bacterium]